MMSQVKKENTKQILLLTLASSKSIKISTRRRSRILANQLSFINIFLIKEFSVLLEEIAASILLLIILKRLLIP